MLNKMLKLLGNDVDLEIAEFSLEKSKDMIMNYCSIDDIPARLENVCINIAIDIFRNGFYGSNDIEPFIKSIDLGDTKTTYEDRNKECTSDDSTFLRPYLKQLRPYRRLRW